MKFKIDDKVRIIDNYIFNPRYHIGDIGKVNGISQDGWLSLTMTDGEIQEVSADKLQSVEIINEQTEMNIPDAVNYCLNHKAVIHTPSIDILYSLMKYLDESVLRWRGGDKASKFNCYSGYKENTCIRINKRGYNIDYSCVNYFKDEGYKIIELTSKSVSIDGISYSYKNIAISKIESIFSSSFPAIGDTYYYIDSEGYIADEVYDDNYVHKNRLSIGNVYKTKDLAYIASERVIKAYSE